MQLHNSFQQSQGRSLVGGGSSQSNNYLQVPGAVAPLKPPTVSPRNSCSQNTSGYQSFSSSTTSLEQSYPPYAQLPGAVSSTSSSTAGCPNRAHYSPDSTYGSEGGGAGGGGGGGGAGARLGRRLSDGVLLGLGNSSGGAGSSSGGGAHLLPGSAESYRSLHYDLGGGGNKHNSGHRAFDFDMKRALGYKAMERTPVAGEMRTPTPAWMGMGLSSTSPAPAPAPLENGEGNGGGGGWRLPPGLGSPYGLSATTGLLDATPVNRRLQLAQHKDIQTLLTSLGLEHYISE